ncbi:MAG: hypothetical protein ACFE9Z_03340 [Promethearchaeota archaeon]
MEEFIDFFHCKLYSKQDIMKWNLPERIIQKIGLDEYDYFFLATPREESHEGYKHVHLSIFPTKYDIINILVVEISSLNPKILEKVLRTVIKHKFDVITTTGTCKTKNNCFFCVFFSKPKDANIESLQFDVSHINEVRNVKISSYTCNGYCEE